MSRNELVKRPQLVSVAETEAIFRRWLSEQTLIKRAGVRPFYVTINSQGRITAVEGQDPPKRLA
jgi:hypothetical protein